MNITITLTSADALTLIQLLSNKTEAVVIVSEIKSSLSKDKNAAFNRQVMS